MNGIGRIVAFASALALAVVLAGCSSGASSSAASNSASTASSSAASAASESVSTSASASSASSADAASSSSASASASTSAAVGQSLAPGIYSATFDTDSSMFHVNEANEGKGVLTVTDEGMTIHVSLVSKKILNLYVGSAADAETDSANVLEPTTDTVTYSDGMSDEVYGFDIPVPVLDEDFDVAIIGEKGKWYDHKVSVSDPEPIEEESAK